jgi:DNA-binding response OmpR family regulator
MARSLVIDDDNVFRTMVQSALERAGHETWNTFGGDKGIHLFRTIPIDLVITDILMQDGDGLETVRAFRRESHDVPIIAVSGGGERCEGDYPKVAEMLGAGKTFTKPSVPEDVLFLRAKTHIQVRVGLQFPGATPARPGWRRCPMFC